MVSRLIVADVIAFQWMARYVTIPILHMMHGTSSPTTTGHLFDNCLWKPDFLLKIPAFLRGTDITFWFLRFQSSDSLPIQDDSSQTIDEKSIRNTSAPWWNNLNKTCWETEGCVGYNFLHCRPSICPYLPFDLKISARVAVRTENLLPSFETPRSKIWRMVFC